MTSVELKDVTKSFGDVDAVKSFSCGIRSGEFMVLVGPSGCGKTTLLRLVLGASKPDKGEICMDGLVVNEIPIEKRNVGFLPQDFGLFPHLTVRDNVAYGLKIRGKSAEMIRSGVGEMLEMLELEDLEDRFPRQLSWGQQQRVALARALVIQPRLLLLDEPLSAVDWITREEIAKNVRGLQQRLRITMLYVTHDIDEALSLGDRVMVMYRGHLEQCDEPSKLIDQPRSEFVRRFVRSPLNWRQT